MITLLNAAPDTGNQGVSALCYAAVAGLHRRNVGQICVADHGRGRRSGVLADAPVDLIGLTHTRRIWRADSVTQVGVMAKMGGMFNAAATAIVKSKAVVDVSGGDSFTDLYGPHRFDAMVKTKRLALDNGVPLVLLPQTLGPFRTTAGLHTAIEILRKARAVWVRDKQSYAFLQQHLGADFDPSIHHLGVDMAVALPQAMPQLPDAIAAVLDPSRGYPLVGLNVSGLLVNDPNGARARFGLADNHIAQLDVIATTILNSDPNLRLLLVPHVNRDLGHPESDLQACHVLRGLLPAALAQRVIVLEPVLNAMELKWVLARLDWFAGARMHATIGAFSSGTPTLGLGYSDKTDGVFDQCGLSAHTLDLRRKGLADLRAIVAQSLANRGKTRLDLAQSLPALLKRASAQMDMIAQQITA
jgi:polysaccharide pyruvyl transferase WcaK-like protein